VSPALISYSLSAHPVHDVSLEDVKDLIAIGVAVDRVFLPGVDRGYAYGHKERVPKLSRGEPFELAAGLRLDKSVRPR